MCKNFEIGMGLDLNGPCHMPMGLPLMGEGLLCLAVLYPAVLYASLADLVCKEKKATHWPI